MGEPPLAARAVLLAILARLASGVPVPAQGVFAGELRMGVAALRARLEELGALVMWPSSGTTGSAPGQPVVSREYLELWMAGEWSPAVVVRKSDRYRCENRTANEALQSENRTASLARAGGLASSSSHDSSTGSSPTGSPPGSPRAFSRTDLPASMDSPQELARDLTLMVSALRRVGIKVPVGLQDDIRSLWCGHFSLAEVEHGAREAARHGAFNVAYVESVMRSERERAGVVEFAVGDGS